MKNLFKNKPFYYLGLVLIVGQANAQSSIPPDYGQRIGDVVVSASRAGTELKDMTQNTSILTNEDLQNSPNQTVDQVLKNQSSVFLNDQPYYEKDPTGQSLNVRGLGNARTLVLIDGVPANDAMYGTVQWNLAPISSIEDVELIRGGVSNLYGNMGMGGVVNITTKPISDNKGEISGSYGTWNTSNIAASKEFAVNDVLKLRISADAFNTDGYVQQPTISPATTYPQGKLLQGGKYAQAAPLQPGMGPESANSSNVRLQGDLKLSGDTKAFFNLGYHTMSNLPNGGYSFASKNSEETTFSGGVLTKLNAKESVQANAYYEWTSMWQQNVSQDPSYGSNNKVTVSQPYISANYSNPYSTLGASAQYTKNISEFAIDQFIASVDARQVAASNLSNQLTTSGANNGVSYAQGSQQFYGLMGQLKSKADAIPMQATLSARLDQWNSQIPTYYVGGANGVNPIYTNAPNQTVYKFSPNLGLLYNASKEWDLRAAAYQGFHAPGLNNQIRSYGTTTNFYASNPNLTPENMTGYEVGTDYRWNSGFVQLTGFNANVTNAVYAATATTSQIQVYCGTCTGGSIYGNNQSIQSRGLELQGHYDFTSKWASDATYTHTNTILTWTGAGVSTLTNPINSQIGGVPQNMGTIGLTYIPINRTSINANVRYVGNSWMDTQHQLPVPSYATVGARINHEVTPGTTVFLSVVNLFNRNYISYNAATTQTSYIVGQPQTVTVGARVVF
jgi:iron complex outermembrane recepter protein